MAPKLPESTKTSLTQRVNAHARDRWPDIEQITVRFRGNFAYLAARLPAGETVPLCRLRYTGTAHTWGFAFYRASHDDYQDSYLPTGTMGGSPKDALDCAGNVYLNDLDPWRPRYTDEQAGPLVTTWMAGRAGGALFTTVDGYAFA